MRGERRKKGVQGRVVGAGARAYRRALADLGRSSAVEAHLAGRTPAVLQSKRDMTAVSLGGVARSRGRHNARTLQSNLTFRPARWTTLPSGSPCLAMIFLLPFCGNVISTEPFGNSFAFFWRSASLPSAHRHILTCRVMRRQGAQAEVWIAFSPEAAYDGVRGPNHVHQPFCRRTWQVP